jgi:GT2 family glycosyltransferase
MQLSIIILNYNVRYFLEQCVLSVQKALINIDAEIIVVDNNSSDESCQIMKSRFPNIKLIENKENLGFPKGNNIAVEQAKGKYICILNPDTVVAEDTFTKILNVFMGKPPLWVGGIGIVGCKLIDGTGNFLPESKRGIPTPWVAFGKIFGLYKLFPTVNAFKKYYAEHLNENTSGTVDILVGAFMVLEKETYQKLGGFDERYFMYGEDIDFSFSALQLGLQNYYFAETTIIHYKGESTVKDQKYRKRFQEGMELFYAKHMKKSLIFSVLMRFGMLFFSIFKMKNKSGNTTTISSQYVLYSNNPVLKSKLETKLKTNIEFKNSILNHKLDSQIASNGEITEIILDADFISYKDCIAFLEQNKNPNIRFKIKPPNCDFLIGSNSSNNRGEVVLF